MNRARRLGANLYCGRKCAAEGRRRRTPEQREAYLLAYREANRERLRQYARDYRASEGRKRVLESQRASYQRNREKNLAAMKRRRESRPKGDATKRVKEWLKRNPEKEALYTAKACIKQATGLSWREIPDDLAEAKAEQLRIFRWAREEMAKTEPEGSA